MNDSNYKACKGIFMVKITDVPYFEIGINPFWRVGQIFKLIISGQGYHS
jgi:hypothetical protein